MLRTKIISNSQINLESLKNVSQVNKVYKEVKEDNNRLLALEIIKSNFEELKDSFPYKFSELKVYAVARLFQIIKSYEFFFAYPLPEYIISNPLIPQLQKLVFEYAQGLDYIDKLGGQDRVNIIIPVKNDIDEIIKFISQLELIFSNSNATYSVNFVTEVKKDKWFTKLKPKKGAIDLIDKDKEFAFQKEYLNEYLIIINQPKISHISSIGVVVGEIIKSDIPVIGRTELNTLAYSVGAGEVFSKIRDLSDSQIWKSVSQNSIQILQEDLMVGYKLNNESFGKFNNVYDFIKPLLFNRYNYKEILLTPLTKSYIDDNEYLYNLVGVKKLFRMKYGLLRYLFAMLLGLVPLLLVIFWKYIKFSLFKKRGNRNNLNYFDEINELLEYYRRRY